MVVSAGGCWGCAPLAGLGGSVGGDGLEGGLEMTLGWSQMSFFSVFFRCR